jgi:hypothetical protein
MSSDGIPSFPLFVVNIFNKKPKRIITIVCPQHVLRVDDHEIVVQMSGIAHKEVRETKDDGVGSTIKKGVKVVADVVVTIVAIPFFAVILGVNWWRGEKVRLGP